MYIFKIISASGEARYEIAENITQLKIRNHDFLFRIENCGKQTENGDFSKPDLKIPEQNILRDFLIEPTLRRFGER